MTDTSSGRLRVDWTIPAPLLIAILLQAMIFVAWIATLGARVDTLEEWRRSQLDTPATLRVLDERTESITKDVGMLQTDVREIRNQLVSRPPQ